MFRIRGHPGLKLLTDTKISTSLLLFVSFLVVEIVYLNGFRFSNSDLLFAVDVSSLPDGLISAASIVLAIDNDSIPPLAIRGEGMGEKGQTILLITIARTITQFRVLSSPFWGIP